ncbi:hypothetical protein [Mangrovibacterium lignilyticum]|uniref:hypothetical protein n=1 Tax=Mangrovibacterium lignilyticum TaxID=2668052 RepID=UPI0013D69C93|nr:hypothetical protein [Mangrovibacterium lignilyticum]
MTSAEIQELLRNWENSELLFSHFANQPKDFEKLLQLVFDDSQAINWRAAWILDHVNDRNSLLVGIYLPRIIEAALQSKNASKLRHYLKIISTHPIPTESAGFLFDRATAIFTDAECPIAVRVHAMQVLYEISQMEPDLKSELIQLIEHEMEFHPSAGIKSRGKRLLKRLNTQIRS